MRAYAGNRTLLGVEPIPLKRTTRRAAREGSVARRGRRRALAGALILEPRAGDLDDREHRQRSGAARRRPRRDAAERPPRKRARHDLGYDRRLYTGTVLTHLTDWYARHGFETERIEVLSDRSITHMMKHSESAWRCAHAPLLRQPVVPVHRSAVPRPLRGGGQGRLQGRRDPNPFEAPRPRSPPAEGQRPDAGAVQHAAGDWTKGERGMSAMPGARRSSTTTWRRRSAMRRHRLQAGARDGGPHAPRCRARDLRRQPEDRRPHGQGRRRHIIIEPINRRDIPGYFLNTIAEARSIIHEVGEPNVGLQFDLYHRQVRKATSPRRSRSSALARHYQIANPPDRGEPDEGELNYR